MEWKLDMTKLQAAFSQYFHRNVARDEVLEWLATQNIGPDLVRGYIYMDLSRPQLQAQFKATSGPLMRRALVFACTGVILVSGFSFLAAYGWQTLRRVPHCA